jgi:hypothetical protein
VSTLAPGSAAAFGGVVRTAAPVHVVAPAPTPSYRWGYGRGWCYWHPYVCYRNR